MIESIRIEDDGPDGTYLVIQQDPDNIPRGDIHGAWPERVVLRISDDVLRDLDRQLQPFRDHWAEGEQVRREFEAHRGAGYCTGWVTGRGPCLLRHGHDGPHSRNYEQREEV